MKSARDHFVDLRELLDDLNDMIAKGGGVFGGGGRVTLNRDKVEDLMDKVLAELDECERDLPVEIRNAERIVAGADNTVEQAKSEARLILDRAKDDAARQTDRHEIVAAAREREQELLAIAEKKAAEEMDEARRKGVYAYLGVLDFIKNVFGDAETLALDFSKKFSALLQEGAEMESRINRYMNEIYDNKSDMLEALKQARDEFENNEK